MIIKTRIFQLCNGNYQNLSELAQAMGLSVSQVYRVREGKRSINHKFILGAKKAFPSYRLDDLFYLDEETLIGRKIGTDVTNRYRHIVQKYTNSNLLGSDDREQGVEKSARIQS
ncbi:hypothetical protein ACFLW4_03795 [Chloroflexota bacterium]